MKTSIFIKKHSPNNLYKFNHVTVSCPISKLESFYPIIKDSLDISVTPFKEFLIDSKTGYATNVFKTKDDSLYSLNSVYRILKNKISQSKGFDVHHSSIVAESISSKTIESVERYLKMFFSSLPGVGAIDKEIFSVFRNIIYDTKIDVENSQMIIFAYTTPIASNEEKTDLKEMMSILNKDLSRFSEIEKTELKNNKDGLYTITITLPDNSPISEKRLQELTIEKINNIINESENNEDSDEKDSDEKDSDEKDSDEKDSDEKDSDENKPTSGSTIETDKGTLILGKDELETLDELIIDNSNKFDAEEAENRLKALFANKEELEKYKIADGEQIVILPSKVFLGSEDSDEEQFIGISLVIDIKDKSILLSDEDIEKIKVVFDFVNKQCLVSESEDSTEILISDLTKDEAVVIRAPESVDIENIESINNWTLKVAKALGIVGFNVDLISFDDLNQLPAVYFEGEQIDLESKIIEESDNTDDSKQFYTLEIKPLKKENGKLAAVIKTFINQNSGFDYSTDITSRFFKNIKSDLYRLHKEIKFTFYESNIESLAAILTIMSEVILESPSNIQESDLDDWVNNIREFFKSKNYKVN